MDETTVLYRPVGQKELNLIRDDGFHGFPPRLPKQPYFYPVLNEKYAAQIARDWNARDPHSDFAGYVLRFAVRTEFLHRYHVHQVGDSEHREYWIPAEDLIEFNRNLIGKIEIIQEFLGKATP